jgi:hypothetical protein
MKAIHTHYCVRCIQIQLPQTYKPVWVRLDNCGNGVYIFSFHD